MDAFLAEKQPKEEEGGEEEVKEEEEQEEAEEAASSSSSEEEEEEEPEEPAPKKAKKSSAAKAKGGEAKPKGPGGFQKPLRLSPAMQAFTGEEKLSRAQIVKKCWVSFFRFFGCFCFLSLHRSLDIFFLLRRLLLLLLFHSSVFSPFKKKTPKTP